MGLSRGRLAWERKEWFAKRKGRGRRSSGDRRILYEDLNKMERSKVKKVEREFVKGILGYGIRRTKKDKR